MFLPKKGSWGFFSGATLMRPSPRFHGDSHKTVKFPVFQKKKKKPCRVVAAVGGVLQLSEAAFQRACRSSWKVKLSCSFFPWIQPVCKFFFFKTTATLAVSKNPNTTTEYVKSHEHFSGIVLVSYFRSSLKRQKIRKVAAVPISADFCSWGKVWTPPPPPLFGHKGFKMGLLPEKLLFHPSSNIIEQGAFISALVSHLNPTWSDPNEWTTSKSVRKENLFWRK